MKQHLVILTLAWALLAAAPVWAANSEQKQALVAARHWLSLVDKGEYVKAWRISAKTFKEMVTSKEFMDSLAAVRRPLGKLLSRQVAARKMLVDPPGKLPGTYYVIQFKAKYRGDGQVLEIITPMKQEDGRWRVAGYLVQ